MISQSWRCLECTRAQTLRDVGWSPMALSSGSLWQEIPKSCDSVAQPDHKPRLCTGTGCPGKHFAHYTGRWRRANRAECQHAAWAHITGTAHTAGTAAPSQPFHCQQVLQLHALSQKGTSPPPLAGLNHQKLHDLLRCAAQCGAPPASQFLIADPSVAPCDAPSTHPSTALPQDRQPSGQARPYRGTLPQFPAPLDEDISVLWETEF